MTFADDLYGPSLTSELADILRISLDVSIQLRYPIVPV